MLLSACVAPTEYRRPRASPTESGSRIEDRVFLSAALGVEKHVRVYLPAGYDAQSGLRYPVFYYLHGLGDSELAWTLEGHLEDAAASLDLQAIVAMADGDASFYVDSPYEADYVACKEGRTLLWHWSGQEPPPRAETCVRANRYETYITQDLIAWVDGTFRTLPMREARGIAGLSMGGYGALMLALRHRDLFAAAASHSGVVALTYGGGHPYVDGAQSPLVSDLSKWTIGYAPVDAWIRGVFGSDLQFWRDHDPAVLIETLQPGQLALYLDCGTEDSLADETRLLGARLEALHLEHEVHLVPGIHGWSLWRLRVRESLAFLRDHLSAAAAH
jgi:putative tributyrin esterase